MIHPAYTNHKNNPKVVVAAKALREAYKTHWTTGASADTAKIVNGAEYDLNVAVETVIAPR